VLTFGKKETQYYKPKYCEEFAQLVKSFTKSELGIQEEIDYDGFGKQIMASIDPKLEPAMMNALKTQLEEMQKELEAMRKQGNDNEMLKAILQANQQQTAALIAALSRPHEGGGGCVLV